MTRESHKHRTCGARLCGLLADSDCQDMEEPEGEDEDGESGWAHRYSLVVDTLWWATAVSTGDRISAPWGTMWHRASHFALQVSPSPSVAREARDAQITYRCKQQNTRLQRRRPRIATAHPFRNHCSCMHFIFGMQWAQRAEVEAQRFQRQRWDIPLRMLIFCTWRSGVGVQLRIECVVHIYYVLDSITSIQ